MLPMLSKLPILRPIINISSHRNLSEKNIFRQSMKLIYSAPLCKIILLKTSGVLALSDRNPTPSKYDIVKEDDAEQLTSKRIWDERKWP